MNANKLHAQWSRNCEERPLLFAGKYVLAGKVNVLVHDMHCACSGYNAIYFIEFEDEGGEFHDVFSC